MSTYWWFIKKKNWVKQVLWELSDSTVTLLDAIDYSFLTPGGMKKCTGDTASFQVCLIHVPILLSLACFITCETTMAPYSETLIRRNATNRVSKVSSIWSFFIDYSIQEIYSTCNTINNRLKSLRKIKGHCWACPTGKLLKLCCSSTAVTCPMDSRAPEDNAHAWTPY